VIGFLEAASDAADRLGDRESQRELLDRLSDIHLDLDRDPRAAGRVYLLHGRYAISTGQYGLARGMLRNAVLLFERAEARLELSEALRRLSAVQAHVGELAEARKLARRALDTAVHDAQRAVAELALGVLDVLEDKVEPALACTTRALNLLRRAREWNLPGAIAAALVLRVRVYRACGRLERALASAERAAHLASIAGEKRLEVEASARIGGTLLELGRLAEAEERLREALLLAEEIEDRRGRALTALFLGLLLAANGDREAADVLERTTGLAHETGLNRIEALALAVRARVALASGDAATASAASSRANALLEQFGAELFDRIVIVATRARVLAFEGRKSEASRLERALRRRLERESERIESRTLRADHVRAAQGLLEAARQADGQVYPRPG
jgi:tetratricopeptide (TPR) repeat protein